ncbi:hypothetical protein FB382_004357 [Nocardioides ginsengisegetis]|uniref:Uncharacterized protein n=1 Tax=Nocardioides ginsengisegetis TaxID=661491 RepID=A0A7W3J3I8_9ACTN|nr:hypothetical protein [Nocardioides ginsengisegetis]MBA8805582.1 hypothetical protein [Nocardioides ginsengisegetis]MBA8806006.1 hypothetical protein [Nocardioides ginsengisegetis]
MSREWKPGDVAIVTNQSGESGRAIRFSGSPEDGWFAERDGIGGDLTDARPLVVIDPENREQVERLCNLVDGAFNDTRIDGTGPTSTELAQAALREFANPTPPKPEEPTGLGAVVVDEKGRLWVNLTDPKCSTHTDPWVSVHDPDRWASYADIAAVKVLSGGVA